ncbi:DsbA family protein [Gracilimonas sp.]|uniref:DsbA family protein n=1 Tax=Gracilimonas sp. TaxID=1974203 RepID=UPI0028713210|nr:thioredoxin domain-containing protein [Gracilimonas sp.]
MKRGLFLLTFLVALFSMPLMAQETEETEPEVTIIKYSDFQCPACKYYVSIEEQIKEAYGDDVAIIYKHFPLNIHPHAQVAARAAEAARAQGKFQEMHDLIFEGQEQWARGNAEAMFIGYARELDLDVEQFQNDMNSADMQRIVMADKREGLDLNVNSTPTFYINGTKLEQNPRTFEQFKSIIDGMMEQE